MAFSHQTVLLDEAVSLLRPGVGRVIVDGTLGGGGHAEALLRGGAHVIGVDRDVRALEAANARLSTFGSRFRSVEGNYSELPEILERLGVGEVDGILLDLGVSSPQLDEPERGFSFQTDGPLDMRMGGAGPTAAELIAESSQEELEGYLKDFGEERFARAIARSLRAQPPSTTFQAVEQVKRAVPRGAWPKKINVATKTFQALRMAVNRELEGLATVLSALPSLLKLGGIAAIISFHSLEDRQVKQAFRELEGRCTCPPGLPICGCGAQGSFRPLTRKAIGATDKEIEQNPRSRSAHLRAVERIR